MVERWPGEDQAEWRQRDRKFKVTLGYIASLEPAWSTQGQCKRRVENRLKAWFFVVYSHNIYMYHISPEKAKELVSWLGQTNGHILPGTLQHDFGKLGEEC